MHAGGVECGCQRYRHGHEFNGWNYMSGNVLCTIPVGFFRDVDRHSDRSGDYRYIYVASRRDRMQSGDNSDHLLAGFRYEPDDHGYFPIRLF